MAGQGAGYDLSVATFSPDGRVFQVEYAAKAVDNSGASVGICCKDGVIVGVRVPMDSKMLVQGTNKRVFAIDKKTGAAVAGLAPDALQIVQIARKEATNHLNVFGEQMPLRMLASNVAHVVHMYTQYWHVRPFGASVLLGSYDEDDGPSLYCVEPAGTCFKYSALALGKGKQAAKTDLEKLKTSELTCRDALFHLVKVINKQHAGEAKDKSYNLQVSWICPESQYLWQQVPVDLVKEADERAKKQMEAEEDEA
eukprot:GHVL01018750.1.p1 GENE.GHVL01018750.1~~GHVL01018750.1.p1  ORF type:complete len:253 (+),score=40.97 GHVL01018750.1:25-783(+)